MKKKVKTSKQEEFEYQFRGQVKKDKGKGAWSFVALPKTLSKKIRKAHSESEEGWGRLKTKAIIGDTPWDTAVWYDTKAEAYLLPVKALVRKRESLSNGSAVKVKLKFKSEDY